MQKQNLKSGLMAVWVLATLVLGYLSGSTSMGGWTLLAAIAFVPPLLVLRYWSAPSSSMSENIQKALH